jgi:parvulin-like peptidyl-prolyl isomerase
MSKARPATTHTAPKLTRKHLARAERERKLRQWLIGSAAVIFAVVAALIAYPLIDRGLVQPGQPVAIVNGVEISTREFQKRVRYTRAQMISQYWNMQTFAQYFQGDPQFQAQLTSVTASLNSPFGMGRDVLDQMVDEELVRQEAARRGLSVSPDEIDAYFRENFGFYPEGTPTPLPTSTDSPTGTPAPTGTAQASATPGPEGSATPTLEPSPTATQAPTATATVGPTPTATPSPTITPTPTPYTQALYDRDYRDYVAQFQRAAGMSEADLRRLVETDLLRDKLTEAWEAEPDVNSVHARHILVEDDAAARQVLDRLAAGEDFAALAAELSTDTSNKDQGGDLGFFERGDMVPEFDAAAFGNPVGVVPEPVQTSFGWHVIEILETRNETPSQAQERALNDWLLDQREDPAQVTTFDYWEDRVPEDPRFDPAIPPTPFPTSAP